MKHAKSARRQRRDSEAERLYLRVLESRRRVLGSAHPETANTAIGLSLLWLDQKKYKQAEPLFRHLSQQNAASADLHFGLGVAVLHQLKYAEAEGEFLQTIKLKQDYGEAYGYLADAARENKHYELAIRALDARAKLLPEDARAYFIRATCYDSLHMFKPAAENYKKFLAMAAGKFPDQEWQARHRLIAIEPKK